MQKNRRDLSLENKAAGFTIIELMVTVAMLAVLLAVAVPSFSDFLRKQKVKSEAQSIARVLSSARANALVIDAGGVFVKWNKTAADITITSTVVLDDVNNPGTSITKTTDQTLLPGAIAAINPDTMEFISVTNFADSSGIVYVDNDDDGEVTFTQKGRMVDAQNGSLGFLLCRGAGDAQDAIRVEVSATGRVVQKLQTNTTAGGVTGLACPAA